MNIVRAYVETLFDAELYSILKDWETFEREGAIGEGALRKHAKILDEKIHYATLTLLMRELAFEVYRHYAMRHLK